MKRIFIGIPMSDSIKKKVAAWQGGEVLAEEREILLDNLHLTLVPPWNVEDEKIEAASKKLSIVVCGIKPFKIKFERIVPGPIPNIPRLFLVDIKLSEHLKQLKIKLDYSFHSKEHRSFRPHLTLFRFKKNEKRTPEIKKYRKEVDWEEQVSSIVLFESVFYQNFSRTEYKKLAEIGLEMRNGECRKNR